MDEIVVVNVAADGFHLVVDDVEILIAVEHDIDEERADDSLDQRDVESVVWLAEAREYSWGFVHENVWVYRRHRCHLL